MKWVFVNEKSIGGVTFQFWQLAIHLQEASIGEERTNGFLVEIKGDGEFLDFKSGAKHGNDIQSTITSVKSMQVLSQVNLSYTKDFLNLGTIKFKCATDLNEPIDKLMVRTTWLNENAMKIKGCTNETMCLSQK